MISIPYDYHLYTAEETRELDRVTIEDFGIDGFTLMELAGTQAAKDIWKRVAELNSGLFLCGRGNNAGDALVVARYLIQRGIDIELVLISGTEKLSTETSKNYGLLNKVSEAEDAGELTTHNSWASYTNSREGRHTQQDFIIDGMLGTGLNSDLRGDYTSAVDWANSVEVPVYAMDIPTGLHADTGQVLGKAIRADVTYTFGARKLGLYLNEAKSHAGDVIFCELPFPAVARPSSPHYLIHPNWIPGKHPATQTQPRHKYEAGVLYVIAGSTGLTGAASMAALSAWREGLGGVVLISPKGLLPYYGDALMQIIKQPVGGYEDDHFNESHFDEISEMLKQRPGSVLLGPGLGRAASTRTFVHRFLENFEGNVLIDADGLDALAHSELSDLSKPEQAEWILTPHPGELGRLTGQSTRDDFERLDLAEELAQKMDSYILSKGEPVMLIHPNGRTGITQYDNTAYNRAGFGDVLAGKIAAFVTLTRDSAYSISRALMRGEELRQAKINQPDSTGFKALEPKDYL